MRRSKPLQSRITEGQSSILQFFGKNGRKESTPSPKRICVRDEIDLTDCPDEEVAEKEDKQSGNSGYHGASRRGRPSRRSGRSSFTVHRHSSVQVGQGEKYDDILADKHLVGEEETEVISDADSLLAAAVAEANVDIAKPLCNDSQRDASGKDSPAFGVEENAPPHVLASENGATSLLDVEPDVKHNGSGGGKRVPYYLANFRLILNTVLAESEYEVLFNKDDMDVFSRFLSLPDKSQQLYVRLHNRKPGWLRLAKLEYNEISGDLAPLAKHLAENQLVLTESSLTDVEEIIRLLPAPDVREIAKAFRVQPKGKLPGGGRGSGLQKEDNVQALLRHCRQQTSVFRSADTSVPVKRRALQLLGGCVKIPADVRVVFERAVCLFAMTTWLDDESQLGKQSSSIIYNLLLTTTGQLVYPQYTIKKEVVIFPSRDAFIMYCDAIDLEVRLLSAFESSDVEEALAIYEDAHQRYAECLKTENWKYASGRPQFLLRFTDVWVLVRLLSHCVELLQRQRRYSDAVQLLRLLLDQMHFCQSSRGRWWERLALNLDSHLKRYEEALDAAAAGLEDTHVRTGHRLALQMRATRLCTSASHSELRAHAERFPLVELTCAKEVVIPGRIYPGETGTKSVFLCNYSSADSDDNHGGGVMLLSVEELAMEHYRCQEGFECGVHAEGSSFRALFMLLFWNIVFSDTVPDVFRNGFQGLPLDFYTDDFYKLRQAMIDERLVDIRQSSTEDLQLWVEQTWIDHEGECAGGMSWELFPGGVQQAKDLVACMGGKLVAGWCEVFAKDNRHSSGGLPDLTLWSPSTKRCKFAEVKGPNDKLAPKQRLWLHTLVELGADVDVCHIKAVGGKHLQRSVSAGDDLC